MENPIFGTNQLATGQESFTSLQGWGPFGWTAGFLGWLPGGFKASYLGRIGQTHDAARSRDEAFVSFCPLRIWVGVVINGL